MKNFLSLAFCAVIFSGCAIFEPRVTPIQTANGLKSEILSYERKSRVSYVYKFKSLNSGQIYLANASRYFYNSGDKVYINAKNGVISNMILISRKPQPLIKNEYQNEGKIVRKTLKNNQNIALPKTENISF